MTASDTTERRFALWLVPAEPARAALTAVIRRLAEQYNAPTFEPHVTVYGGCLTDGDAMCELLDTIVTNVPPLTLTVKELDWTDEFFKTLFIAFESSDELADLCERMRRGLSRPAPYYLQPHLSLLYKQMPTDQKRRIIAGLDPPPSRITCDEARIVSPANPTAAWRDVASWRNVATRTLARSQHGH